MTNPASRGTVSADTCAIDNCTNSLYLRGWCCAHYQRWRLYGDPTAGGPLHRPRGLSFEEAIEWELRHAIPDGECLLSHHVPGDRGYAATRIGGRYVRIHRAVLEHKLGRRLDRHEEACHACHRPLCINPEHLYVGTHGENMADMKNARRGRSGQRPGAANSAARFTEEQVAGIRRKVAEGATQASIAKEYGASSGTISRIVRRINYP